VTNGMTKTIPSYALKTVGTFEELLFWELCLFPFLTYTTESGGGNGRDRDKVRFDVGKLIEFV
jgi:hypothetical protein